MGRAQIKQKHLSKELEKKVEKYFNETQKLQTLWNDITTTLTEEGMNPEVFSKGIYTFLGDPIDVLYKLKHGEVTNYDMFIAELEDIIDHYDLIVKGEMM